MLPSAFWRMMHVKLCEGVPKAKGACPNKFRVGARLTRRNFSCPTFFRSAGVLTQPQIRRLRRIFYMYRCGLSMSAPLYDHNVEPIQSTLLHIHFPRDSILSHVRAVSCCAISNFTCQVVKLFVTHAPLPPLHAENVTCKGIV